MKTEVVSFRMDEKMVEILKMFGPEISIADVIKKAIEGFVKQNVESSDIRMPNDEFLEISGFERRFPSLEEAECISSFLVTQATLADEKYNMLSNYSEMGRQWKNSIIKTGVVYDFVKLRERIITFCGLEFFHDEKFQSNILMPDFVICFVDKDNIIHDLTSSDYMPNINYRLEIKPKEWIEDNFIPMGINSIKSYIQWKKNQKN